MILPQEARDRAVERAVEEMAEDQVVCEHPLPRPCRQCIEDWLRADAEVAEDVAVDRRIAAMGDGEPPPGWEP